MNAKVAGRALAISIIREANPNLRQRDVAEMLGIHPTTVSWTMLRVGTPWRRGVYPKASAPPGRHYAHCEGRCPECRRRAAPRLITQPCGWCGKPVTRTLAVVRGHMKATGKSTTTLFCDRHHRGYWFGHKYGVQPGEVA